MILRILLIAILIFIFIRISKRLIAGVREVTGSGTRDKFGQNRSEPHSPKNRRFDNVQDAEFEDVTDVNKKE